MNAAVSHLQDLLGITLDAAWVQRSVPGTVDRDTLLKAFLLSDVVESSPGCLPADWQSRPQLQGTFVLQLNEVVNIAAPVRDRYKPDTGRRCLKLHLSDGSIQCLGGCVQRLEGARQRLLAHWNKPLGCSLLSVQERRTFQQLMLEAQQAAWPQAQQAIPQSVAQTNASTGQQHHQLAVQHAIEPAASLQIHAAPNGSHCSPAAYPAHRNPNTAMPPTNLRSGTGQLHPTTEPVTAVATPAVAAHAHATMPPSAQALPTSGVGIQGNGPGLHQGGPCLLRTGEAVNSGHAIMAPRVSMGIGRVSTSAALPSQLNAVSSGPSFAQQSAGQAMLPCLNRQPAAQHCAGLPAHGAAGGATAGPNFPTNSAGMLPGHGGAETHAAQASGGDKGGDGDVIMIESDDEPASIPVGSAPPTTRACNTLAQLPASTTVVAALGTSRHCIAGPSRHDSMPLRPSHYNAAITGEFESDDDEPLVSKPWKLPGSNHRSAIHCAGSENTRQGNREAGEVLIATSVSDAVAKCKSRTGSVFQVPATFQYLDVHMLDDQDNPNLEYHIEGRIEDNSGMSPGHAVVKPDFLSACGLGNGPADFLAVTEEFVAHTGQNESHAPICKLMDLVLERLQQHGTLLIEWRQNKFHVGLPADAIESIKHSTASF